MECKGNLTLHHVQWRPLNQLAILEMMALLQFFIYDGKLGEAGLTDLKVVKHLFFRVHVKISKKSCHILTTLNLNQTRPSKLWESSLGNIHIWKIFTLKLEAKLYPRKSRCLTQISKEVQSNQADIGMMTAKRYLRSRNPHSQKRCSSNIEYTHTHIKERQCNGDWKERDENGLLRLLKGT